MNAFVTGGSRGIGRAIVLKYISEGWGVGFSYSANQAAADETIKLAHEINPQAKIQAWPMELAKPAQIEQVCEAAIQAFGDISAVVNNAAIVRDNAAVLMSNEQWEEVIAVNLSGPFYVSRAFLLHFISNRKGRFVHLSSLSADGSSGQINYASAKAGLNGLSQTLAKEYAKKGITSNVVTVGFVPTDMTQNHMSEQLQKFWVEHCPAKRVGKAEEIAGMVHYLSTDVAAFISGENIRISGAFTYAP